MPKTKTGILKFLGLVRYYQRFVPHLSELSQPLTSLLRKDRSINEWGPEQDSAVAKIKEVFASADVLTHFKEGRQIVLMTDASHYAMGAVLSQIVDEEGTEKPICFLSKTFDRHQVNYTVTEKECLAVVWAHGDITHPPARATLYFGNRSRCPSLPDTKQRSCRKVTVFPWL